jgi:hypothetical protein
MQSEADGYSDGTPKMSRILRHRHDDLQLDIDQAIRTPTPRTDRMLVQIYDGGHVPSSMPTSVPGMFLGHPVELSGDECEGCTAGQSVDSDTSIPVVVLGPGVPVAGDKLVTVSTGGRWVAEKTGKPVFCGVSCPDLCGGRTVIMGTITDDLGTWPVSSPGQNAVITASVPNTCNPSGPVEGPGYTGCGTTTGSPLPAYRNYYTTYCNSFNLLYYSGSFNCASGPNEITSVVHCYPPATMIPSGPFVWPYSSSVSITCTDDSVSLTREFSEIPASQVWNGGLDGHLIPVSAFPPPTSQATLTWYFETPTTYVCCSPCRITAEQVHELSWINSTHGSGLTLMNRTATSAWSTDCVDQLIFSLSCHGGSLGLSVSKFDSETCDSGRPMNCALSLTDYTCEPFHLHFRPVGPQCSFLTAAGYTDFYIDE